MYKYYFILSVLILLLIGCVPAAEAPIEPATGSSGEAAIIEPEIETETKAETETKNEIEAGYPFKLRIRNNTDEDFEQIEFTLEDRSESISMVAAGEVSEYVTFGEARQLPTLKMVAGGTDYVWQPEQAAGERLLLGEFTYEVDLEHGELNVGPLTENAFLQDAQLFAEQTGIELSEALSQLQSQDEVGTLQVKLAEEHSETFAGLWTEHEPTYRIIVAFTRDGEETIQPYIENSPLADKVEVRSAEMSYVELENLHNQTIGLTNELGLPVSSSINIQENIVELYVTDQVRFDAALAQANATLPKNVVVSAVYEPVGESPPFDVTPEPSIFMPQLQVRSTAFMEALLVGELVVQDGCLVVQSGEESMMVIWQADYYLNNRDGTIEILNETGEVMAQVGETIEMGGGEVSFSGELESSLREPIPEPCGQPQKVWLMGEFLPKE